MLRQSVFAAAAVCALGWPAHAQDALDFMSGVFASSQADCDKLAKGGLSALEEGAVLTSEGLRAYEYSCDFIDVKPRPGANKGWFATAICQAPDETFPDVASIVPSGDNTLQATFMTDWVLANTGQEDSGDDATTGGDDGQNTDNQTPPTTEQTAKNKDKVDSGGGSAAGGGTAGDDTTGAGGSGGTTGSDDTTGAGGSGDDNNPGTGGDDTTAGDDDNAPPEAVANQFFFCPNVQKDAVK